MTRDPGAKPDNTHDISEAGDRYEALAEFLDQHASQTQSDRVREEAERRRRRQQRRRSPPYWIAGVLLVLTAWLWIFPPSFLRLDAPEPPPIEEEEAALRFAMFIQVQRIEAYVQETGQLPERLEEAGPPLPNMRYVRLSPGLYQLSGVTERLTLTYRSDLPLDEFVGSGADLIGEEPL